MGKELLLEIGTEEIPARFLPGALKQMAEVAGRLFAEARVKVNGLQTFGTPRRLILHLGEVAEYQDSYVEEAVGPPRRICYDENGQPTKAALGFAKNRGVLVEELQIKTIEDKGEYLVAVKKHQGLRTEELLGDLLKKFISSLSFPKMMHWGEGTFLFARPVHWLLALLGGEIIHFSLDSLESGNCSFGHRFTSPDSFPVHSFASYLQKMEEAQVMVSPMKRKEIIQQQIAVLAGELGGRVPDDQDLLDTVTYLVEYPQAICGSFDERFLRLPKEVLITSMRSHQKYFPLYNQHNELMARFIAICNLKTDDYTLIRAGNERVLRARLTDAEFFYNEDRKKPLAEQVEGLKKVVFQEKLGSIFEKVERIQGIATWLIKGISLGHLVDEQTKSDPELESRIDRAAYLCKADLLTEMVYEFPELQGIMGREYALLSGEKPEVATAIYEHYLPRFQNDELPKTISGCLIAIADKIDNIVGCFGIGLIPTGSEDPYALRRQAQGLVQIVLKGGYRLSITDLIEHVIQLFGRKLTRSAEEVKNEVIVFIQQRVLFLLTSQGYGSDVIEAVLATGDDDLARIQKKVEAVNDFRKEPGFESLMTSFKRVINIIPKDWTAIEIDPSFFQEEAERQLYNQVIEVKTLVLTKLRTDQYREILPILAGLKIYIDRFFEEILVMATEEKVKQNRLSLLSMVKGIFSQIVDFSRIVSERG